ncbi:MAG: segregation/condensation protein A [Geopsychrobacter sp.]|nr:segregation/condensation protein A [Geopsychrobacter sp.]
MSIAICLSNFDGPLDLLLHLIKTNEMDISDIQMVEITEQYLSVIEQMKQMDLDVAGEFLLMAATLIHIKSRMLLPAADELEAEEEDVDPRAELVRRLLEYQRYKDAALCLNQFPCVRREVFLRQYLEPDIAGPGTEDPVNVGIYQLAAAFHQLLNATRVEVVHEVVREQLSVADFIHKILDHLQGHAQRSLGDFFKGNASRQELVVTFLAMLELVKMRMLKISQSAEFQPVWLSLSVSEPGVDAGSLKEVGFGYG